MRNTTHMGPYLKGSLQKTYFKNMQSADRAGRQSWTKVGKSRREGGWCLRAGERQGKGRQNLEEAEPGEER